MPVRAAHHIEDLLDEVDGHVFVEEVAHGVDEDDLRLLPTQRDFQCLRMQREFEAVNVVGLAHGVQTLCHTLGIAMLTARADLGTAR